MISVSLRGRLALTLCIFACAAASPFVARAQDVSRITVALVRHLPDTSASATIIRTLTGTTLLLRENADAATLATAMKSMYRARERVLDRADQKLVVNVHGQRRLTSLTPDERRLGDYYLARLHAARPAALPDVGMARSTTIPLEPRSRCNDMITDFTDLTDRSSAANCSLRNE